VNERRWVGPASVLVLALVLAATVGGVLVTREQLDRRLEELAASALATVRHDVQLNLQRDVAAAEGLARSWPELTTIDRATYERTIEEVAERGVFSSVAAVSLNLVTPAEEIDDVLAALPEDVLGSLDVRLGDGPLHVVGLHTWPRAPNRAVLGYDAFLRPRAAPALDAAIRTETVQSTDPLEVVQETAERRSTVVYVPIAPDGEVVGVTSLVFRASGLLEDVGDRLPPGTTVRWTDVTEGLDEAEGLLAETGVATRDAAVARGELEELGRSFRFEVTVPSTALGAAERRVPLLVGALGAVISVAFLLTVVAWRRTAARAADLATRRTAALAAATAELELANAELRELDRLKDRLLSSVTHDLRSPLAVIGGVTQLLLDRPDIPEDKRHDLLRRVRRQASRLRGLIDELLVAAQVRSGVLVADRRPLDLAPLVDEVLSDLNVGAVAAPAEALPPVLADRVHVERILHNLVMNAVHHGAPPIGVGLAVRDGVVELHVRDRGPGVPPELRDRVFREYGRSGEAGPGYGLGLTIATELAEANGGSLSYRDADGPGACFVLELPVADVHEDDRPQPASGAPSGRS
jgi:signal transduction histidine kinase